MNIHYSTASEKILEQNISTVDLTPLALFRLGFMPGRDESRENFHQRVHSCLTWSKGLDQQDLILPEYKVALQQASRIPKEHLYQDAAIIRQLYGACPDWVPAFLDDRQLPLLTAGMAVQLLDPPSQQVMTWFQLKPVFRLRSKWLIYSRQEIISHEMCHVCRFPLQSQRYEESLAYKTSTSSFRRKIGGALLSSFDSKILLLSLLSWVMVDMFSIFNFHIPLALSMFMRLFFPLLIILGLCRNFRIQKELKLAENRLKDLFGDSASSVLFCLDDEQISQCSKLSTEALARTLDPTFSWQFQFLEACFPRIYKPY